MSGALHHLIIRGIERKRIFRNDQDRNNFLNRLGLIRVESKTSCYAGALLSNHLLLRTGQVPLATVMGRLLTGYAVAFNHKYGRHGQLFQNRYKSILCQEDSYFLKLVRYIHLNLLRAGMVQDYKSLGQGRAVHFREVGSAGSGDIWDGGRRYLVVGQTCQDCARTECILLLGGERTWNARNGGGAVAEIDPAGSVYFSEERATHRQREKT